MSMDSGVVLIVRDYSSFLPKELLVPEVVGLAQEFPSERIKFYRILS